ncbi:MAG: hypothetical protein HOJ74_11680, partial [Gemmatimonadales bacterium]|nr:hypothetical protein [Gemmatimonadales bacterium]
MTAIEVQVMLRALRSIVLSVLAIATVMAPAPAQVSPDQFESATQALKWREVGPTIMSGRVSDLAVV